MPTTGVQNFKPIYLYLAVQWPQNQVRAMMSLFLKLDFWNFKVSYDKTNHIFGILGQNWTR